MMCCLSLSLAPFQAHGQCKTDFAKRWLCAGDKAPLAGHLVPPDFLIACAADKKRAGLVPDLQLQLDTCLERQGQADQVMRTQAQQINELHVKIGALEQRPTWWSVTQWSAGALGLGLLVGMIAGALAW